MMRSIVSVFVLLNGFALAFRPNWSTVYKSPECSARSNASDKEGSRRSFLHDAMVVSAGLITANYVKLNSAQASGGATAGGPYLLSAKQRYNDRVIAGMKSFLSLASSLDGGDFSVALNFFSTENVGSWKDASAAGFLLSNAFRRNSSAAPDSLPAVKKWKAFAKQVEALQQAVKRKNSSTAVEAYNNAANALDAYLSEVELPSSAELMKG